MDLILKSEVKEGLIVTNFDEVKGQIEKMVEPFTGLVFTEDQTKEAKEALAKLRKFRKEIDDRRKAVKKQWMSPYTAFDNLAKELLSIVDTPIGEIDSQVKQAEENRKKEKQEAIDELKSKIVECSDYSDFIYSLDWFDDPRWLNASVTLKKVEKDITESVQVIEKNLAIISQTTGELADATTADFQVHGDLQQAILNAKSEYARKCQAAEAQRIAKESEESRLSAGEMVKESISQQIKEDKTIAETAEEARERTHTLRFEITASMSFFAALRAFLDSHGISAKRL